MSKTEELIEKLAVAITRDGERWRDEYRAGMSQFANGVRLQAARPVILDRAKVLWGGPCRLVGWSIEGVGGAAKVRLRNGRDNTADVVATLSVTADGIVDTRWMGPGGLDVGEALYADVVAGTVIGTVYLGAVD